LVLERESGIIKGKENNMEEKEYVNYTRIPNIILDDERVSVYALNLYAVILRTCKIHKMCWKSIDTLTKEAKMSRTLVIKSRKELEKLGYIETGTFQDGNLLRYGSRPTDIKDTNEKYQSIYGLY